MQMILLCSILSGVVVLMGLWLYAEKKSAKRRFDLYEAEKELLVKQMDVQTQKINALERLLENKEEPVKDGYALNLMFVDDLIKLVNKKLPGNDEYIEMLGHIDDQYVNALKRIAVGSLTIPYLKYCVCFAIGLKINEVAECFSIEPSSVHMVRYRLKKKFGLSNQDDLNAFLRQLQYMETDNSSLRS